MVNKNEITLHDALNAFVGENDRPTAENVHEWVNRYPQFRKDLVEFAACWSEQSVLPPAKEIGAEAERALVARAMSNVLNLAYSRDVEAQEQAAGDDALSSLTQAAQSAGSTPLQLANECGLDLSLLSKLNNKQIQPHSIPPKLMRMLAENLHETIGALKAYFSGPSIAVTGKSFLSQAKPTAMQQQSFADAVRSSSLSEDEKSRWLNEGTIEES